MGGHAIGLEAAHIKWFPAHGPDVVPNGLALCSVHHKIFDLGAFTVLPGNHQIVFSRHRMGGDDAKAKLLAHHGAGLIQPQGQGMPAASGVFCVAPGGSVQGAGAGVAGRGDLHALRCPCCWGVARASQGAHFLSGSFEVRGVNCAE